MARTAWEEFYPGDGERGDDGRQRSAIPRAIRIARSRAGQWISCLVISDEEAYCQPCLSPVWDTSLVAHALLEAGEERAVRAALRGLHWLQPLQILDVRGDGYLAVPMCGRAVGHSSTRIRIIQT